MQLQEACEYRTIETTRASKPDYGLEPAWQPFSHRTLQRASPALLGTRPSEEPSIPLFPGLLTALMAEARSLMPNAAETAAE